MNPIRILLVDDEPQTRTSLHAWLVRCGFAVVAVDGPAPADRALGQEVFDLILSDVCMPGNVRLEWIARRVASEGLPPVLLMTGSPDLENALRAANLPVAGYVLKPFDFSSTRSRIEVLAAEHRRRLELLALSHEVLRLLALRLGPPAEASDPFAVQLHHLACELSTQARRHPREAAFAAEAAHWRNAVLETILAIESTPDSAHAAELAALRQRLVHLVDPAQLLQARATAPVDPSHN